MAPPNKQYFEHPFRPAGGRGDWRLLRTTASELGPRRKDKEGIHEVSVQTDSPRTILRNMSQEMGRHVRNDEVKHLPTHASPMRLEIAELLKGKPCVYLGAGYSNSRQQSEWIRVLVSEGVMVLEGEGIMMLGLVLLLL